MAKGKQEKRKKEKKRSNKDFTSSVQSDKLKFSVTSNAWQFPL